MGSDHGLGAWQRIGKIARLQVPGVWKLVLVMIAWHEAMRSGISYASVATLARETSFSRRWIGVVLESLRNSDLISIERRKGLSPLIEIDWDLVDELIKPTREASARVPCSTETLSEPLPENSIQPIREVGSRAPVNSVHEPANSIRTSALRSASYSAKEQCGSHAALTQPPSSEKIPGSTLTPEEIESRKRFVEEVRPDWAKKGHQ